MTLPPDWPALLVCLLALIGFVAWSLRGPRTRYHGDGCAVCRERGHHD